MLLLRLLAGPTLCIFGVGDDDQTIYGYSGATPRWLVDFDAFVPARRHHALTVNYRCPAAGRQRRDEAPLAEPGPRAASDRPGPESAVTDGIPGARIEAIADDRDGGRRCAAAAGRGRAPSEIAVLDTGELALRPCTRRSSRARCRCRCRDGLGFLERAGVAAALAWLRLAPRRLGCAADLALAARRPSRGISPKVIEWIGEQSDVDGIDRLAARVTDKKAADKVAAFATDLRRATQRAASATSSMLLESTSSELGLARSMRSLDEAHRPQQPGALRRPASARRARAPPPRSRDLPRLARPHARHARRAGGVTLATVHRVKGLEWPHVIVHDATTASSRTDSARTSKRSAGSSTSRSPVRSDRHDRVGPGQPLDVRRRAGGTGPQRRTTWSPTTLRRRVAASSRSTRSSGSSCAGAGTTARCSSVDQHHATVAIGTSTITVPFGAEVAVGGQARTLVAPRTTSTRDRTAPVAGAGGEAFEALRAWRLARSKHDAVPAFVVASDKTLPGDRRRDADRRGVAPRRPRDRRHKGRLYGDEILAVLDAARPAL